MRKISRPLLLAAIAASLVPLSGCAMLGIGGGQQTKADTHYVARDVNTLYNAG